MIPIKIHTSTGFIASLSGKTKIIYAGKLRNPFTWFNFYRATIIDSCSADHIAIIKNTGGNNDTD